MEMTLAILHSAEQYVNERIKILKNLLEQPLPENEIAEVKEMLQMWESQLAAIQEKRLTQIK
jgi:hypothetical protein